MRLASAIRPATDREVPLAVDVLRRAGFGTQVARLLEFPRRSPDGAILVAEGAGGSVVGVACCAAFATTGWIGALGVAPEARRHGLGAALTEAAVRWLRGRGARTVLLYATEAGRPVYERLGFVTEERAVAWRGVAGAAPADRPAAPRRRRPPAPEGARPGRHRRAARQRPGRHPPARRRGRRRRAAWPRGLGDRVALGRGHGDRRAGARDGRRADGRRHWRARRRAR